MKIRCWFLGHDWEIFKEVSVEGNGSSNPADYTVGGVDYHLRCTSCKKEWCMEKRSVWREPEYPKSSDFSKGESYIEWDY